MLVQQVNVALLLTVLVISHGYRAFYPSKVNVNVMNSISISSPSTRLYSSYDQKMEEARQRKASRSDAPPPPSSPPAAPAAPSAVSQKSPYGEVTIPGYTPPPTGGLPFSDDMYDHLKFVISKMTEKIKRDVSLSPQELDRFEHSVEMIIKDAVGDAVVPAAPAYVPAPVSVSVPFPVSAPAAIQGSPTLPSTTTIDEVADESNDTDEFAEFRGLGSSMVIPNNEHMTKDEYYAALQKRNSDIREKRRKKKTLETMEPSNDYMNFLNNRKK